MSASLSQAKPLASLLAERELMLRYIIYSAPVEVRLGLPAGALRVEDLDLAGVDAAALVQSLHSAAVSGAAVEVDLTDCPIRRCSEPLLPAATQSQGGSFFADSGSYQSGSAFGAADGHGHPLRPTSSPKGTDSGRGVAQPQTISGSSRPPCQGQGQGAASVPLMYAASRSSADCGSHSQFTAPSHSAGGGNSSSGGVGSSASGTADGLMQWQRRGEAAHPSCPSSLHAGSPLAARSDDVFASAWASMARACSPGTALRAPPFVGRSYGVGTASAAPHSPRPPPLLPLHSDPHHRNGGPTVGFSGPPTPAASHLSAAGPASARADGSAKGGLMHTGRDSVGEALASRRNEGEGTAAGPSPKGSARDRAAAQPLSGTHSSSFTRYTPNECGVQHADNALIRRGAGGAGGSSDGYDAGDAEEAEAAMLLGGGHVAFLPSCVTTKPSSSSTHGNSNTIGNIAANGPPPASLCPMPMAFDSAASVCGDLFDPFENAGHPFAAWLYDVALVSSGMLMGIEAADGTPREGEGTSHVSTPNACGGGGGGEESGGTSGMLRAHIADGDAESVAAVLEALRRALGVSDADHEASYAAFFPPQEAIARGVAAMGAAPDVPPPALASGSFYSAAEFAALRAAMSVEARVAVATAVAPTPQYMAGCLHRSAEHHDIVAREACSGVRGRHTLLAKTKAGAFGEAKGQFPAAVKALALAGIMSLAVRVVGGRPEMDPFALLGDLSPLPTDDGRPLTDNNNTSNTLALSLSHASSSPSSGQAVGESSPFDSSATAEWAHFCRRLGLVARLVAGRLGIPPSVYGLCRVHAVMIAQRRVNDEAAAGTDTVATQGAFLHLIAATADEDRRRRGGQGADAVLSAVGPFAALGPSSPTNLRGGGAEEAAVAIHADYRRYRDYIQESLLQLAAVPLLAPASMGVGPARGAALQGAARALAVSCVASCEAGTFGAIVDAREVPFGGRCGPSAFRYCLAELLSAGLYVGGALPAADDSLSTHKALMGVAAAHAASLSLVAPSLGPLVPCAPILLLRAAFRLLGHTLWRRWGAAAASGALPDNFTTGVHSLREAVDAIIAATRAALPTLPPSSSSDGAPAAPSSRASPKSGTPSARPSPAASLTSPPSSAPASSASPQSSSTAATAGAAHFSVPLAQMLSHAVRQAVEESIDWLYALFEARFERVAAEMQTREAELLGRLAVPDGGVKASAAAVSGAVSEVFLLYRQLFDPLPSAILLDPNDLFMQFTSRVLNQVNTIAVAVCRPFCISEQQRDFAARLPPALRPREAAGFLRTWKLAVAQMDGLYPSRLHPTRNTGGSGGSAPVEGLVQRMNVLRGLHAASAALLADVRGAHGRVRAIAGCGDLAALGLFAEQLASEQSPIVSCLRDLADCLAIQHIKGLYTIGRGGGSGGDAKGGFSRVYLTDMAAYRSAKAATGAIVLDRLVKGEEGTLAAIVDAFDAAIPSTLSLIADYNCRNRVVASCHRYFMAAAAEALLDGGPGRWFAPSHVPSLLADLDEAVEYFGTTAPTDAMVTDTAAYDLARMLRRLVAELFSAEAAALIKAYDGSPETSAGAPMCRMAIRHVLAHRKDKEAKTFAEKHPPLLK